MSIEWGNVGTWAGATGTFLAVSVALWVALRDSRRRRHDEHHKQAHGVASWIMYTSIVTRPVVVLANSERTDTDRAPERCSVHIGLVNDSVGVIYNVAIVIAAHNTPENSVDVLIDAIGPGRWTLGDIPLPPQMNLTTLTLSIHFTDQRGLTWTRQPDGSLTHTHERHQPPDGPNRRARVIPTPLSNDQH